MKYNRISRKICKQCKCIYEKNKSDSYDYFLNRRMYCSKTCADIAKRGICVSPKTQFKIGDNAGNKNFNWRGGTRHVNACGYVVIWTPDGKKLEHRHIMERSIGRKLASNEHVHHKNGNKTDNRIENLEIISDVEHGRMHAYQRWHTGGCK